MGRRRYRKGRTSKWGKNGKNPNNIVGEDGYDDNKDWFTPFENSQVEKWLLAYKLNAGDTCDAEETDVASVARAADLVDVFERTNEDHGEHDEEQSPTFYRVGTHRFPVMNDEALRRPFLFLPPSLSKRQRKAVHEFCTNVDLYHGSTTLEKVRGVLGETDTKTNDERVGDGDDVVRNDADDGDGAIDTKKKDDDDDDDETSTRKNTNTKEDRTEPLNAAEDDDAEKDRPRPDTDVPVRDAERRLCVVSAHETGFERLYRSKLLNPPVPMPRGVREIRPWFYQRNDDDDDEEDRPIDDDRPWTEDPEVARRREEALSVVDELEAYPSNCLPESDSDGGGGGGLDLSAWSGRDLSSVPGWDDDDDGGHPLTLVDDVASLERCAREIEATLYASSSSSSSSRELAFDLEMHNPSRYQNVTCLLQLSVAECDYVVDVLAPGVWDRVGDAFRRVFSDPDVVKIGHGIGGSDVAALHRDFGLFVINAFDTCEAARLCGHKKSGLAHVCEHYGLPDSDRYVELKAAYQMCDWRRRPLTDDMLRYGSYDAHWLLPLRRLLLRDLASTTSPTDDHFDGDGDANLLVDDGERSNLDDDGDDGDDSPPHVLNRDTLHRFPPAVARSLAASQEKCRQLWTHREETPAKLASHAKVTFWTRRNMWRETHSALLTKLCAWRRRVSVRERVGPHAVCSTDLLVSVALRRPTTWTELRRVNYFLPELLSSREEEDAYAEELLTIVRASVAEETARVAAEREEEARVAAKTKDDRNNEEEKDGAKDVDPHKGRETALWTTPTSTIFFRSCAIVAAVAVVLGLTLSRKKISKK